MAERLSDGQLFTDVIALSENKEDTFRVLELGSGTGLGGLFASAQLQKQANGRKIEIHMTDICEKGLDVVGLNIELNN